MPRHASPILLAVAVSLSCDGEEPAGGDATTGASSGTAASSEGSSAGDEQADSSSGGNGQALDSLSATGTVNGQAFTIECTMHPASFFEMAEVFDWQCQASDASGSFTGAVNLIQLSGKGWGTPGTYTVDPLFTGSVTLTQPDMQSFATSQAESSTLETVIEATDGSTWAGTLAGGWTQEGTEITLAATFNFSVETL